MKKIAVTLIAVLLTACTTEGTIKKIFNDQEVANKIGDTTKTPDLYVPQLEYDWSGLPGGMGLWSAGTYPITKNSLGENVVNYSCWIANNLLNGQFDYSGQSDFVVNVEEDGIPINPQAGDYNFPGMLSITTFQNGLPVAQVEKQRFFVSPTDFKVGFEYSRMQQYSYPFMSIPCGTADEYVNKAKVVSGRNLVVVKINPDKQITERDYDNNISVLPINVTFNGATTGIVGTAILDQSIINDNKAHSPTNILVTKKFTGRDKFVTIDWDCPYHSPIYVKHWFTIKKNGVVVADNLDESIYTEMVAGSYKTSTYQIIINVEGLGKSEPSIVTVTK